MRPKDDLCGMRFGALIAAHRVVASVHNDTQWNHGALWLCRCDCGKECVVGRKLLTKGKRTTCGCRSTRFLVHGMSRTPTHLVWKSMMRRCYRPATALERSRYFDRGIRVCERWHDFQNFFADMGERPHGMEIDRVNNEGNYEPGNCRWATRKEQARNTSSNVLVTYSGVTQCLSAWDDEMGFPRGTVGQRVRRGWPAEKAINTKVRKAEANV